MRISFNVNGMQLGDKQYFSSVMTRLRPTSMGIMDGLALADEVYQQVGGIVWHRSSVETNAHLDGISPDELANRWRAEGALHIYRYGINEPLPNPETLDWLVRLMHVTAEKGIRCVVGNIGSVNCQPDAIEAGQFDEYLRTLAQYDGWHIAGWHEYTSCLLPWGCGGRDPELLLDSGQIQPDHWPHAEDITHGPNWHVLRSLWFNDRARTIGVPVHKKLLSECFWDDMPDLRQRGILDRLESQLNGGVHIRGPRTLTNLWARYFPNWSYEQALVEQLKWADRVYPDDYLGFNLFTWSFAGDWTDAGFELASLRSFHELLIQWAAEEQHPQPEEPLTRPEPGTIDKKDKKTFIVVWKEGLWVREEPSQSAIKIGELSFQDRIQVDEGPRQDDDPEGLIWWRHDDGVALEGGGHVSGWSAERRIDGTIVYLREVDQADRSLPLLDDLEAGPARARDFFHEPLFDNHLPVQDPTRIIDFGGFGPNDFSYKTYAEARAQGEAAGGDYARINGLHNGLDFGVPQGTMLCAPDWGVVLHVSQAGEDNPFKAGPYSVIVRYGMCLTVYGHMLGSTQGTHMVVQEGQIVKPGTPIGLSGIGNNYEHLHLEMRRLTPGYVNRLLARAEADDAFDITAQMIEDLNRGAIEWGEWVNPAPFFTPGLETYHWPHACLVSADIDSSRNGYPDRVIVAGAAEPVAYDLYSLLSYSPSIEHFWKGSRLA